MRTGDHQTAGQGAVLRGETRFAEGGEQLGKSVPQVLGTTVQQPG